MPLEKVFQETRRSKKAEIQAQASIKRSNDERTNNDPKHTSRYIQGFFAEKGITWWRSPAESPDLNPIELVWGACVCYFCGLPHGALTVFAVYCADVKQIFRGFPVCTFAEKHKLLLSRTVLISWSWLWGCQLLGTTVGEHLHLTQWSGCKPTKVHLFSPYTPPPPPTHTHNNTNPEIRYSPVAATKFIQTDSL